jgi:hypothetical protein
MGGLELKDIITIATIIFAAGIIYQRIGTVERTLEKIQITLFGNDGRNGLVGDTHSLKEHIKGCPFGHGKRSNDE